jgi:hypothetical protein
LRELLRVQCQPTSAIHEMTAFIKAEAGTALSALKGPPRSRATWRSLFGIGQT